MPTISALAGLEDVGLLVGRTLLYISTGTGKHDVRCVDIYLLTCYRQLRRVGILLI